MRYRSEVGIVFKKSEEKLFFEKMNEWDAINSKDNEYDSARALLEDAEYRVVHSDSLNEDCVVIFWASIKWHHIYNSVEFFTKVQDKIDMDFVRVGEGYDDIEEKLNLKSDILSYYTKMYLVIDSELAGSYVVLHKS